MTCWGFPMTDFEKANAQEKPLNENERELLKRFRKLKETEQKDILRHLRNNT